MFSFPQIDPETTGQVTRMPVPLDKYLSASFDQGQHDSAFNSIMRMGEIGIDNADPNSPMLDPETANKKYAVGDLKFDQPIKEATAATMSERKKSEMDRQFTLSQGASKGRFLPGMAAGIVGGMSNPIDLSLAFVPFVGEERLAASIAESGGGSVRQAIARGLITREAIQAAGIPAPKLAASALQGTLNQSLFEIPNLVASIQDKADYGVSDAVRNIVGGGIFAGAIHGAGAVLHGLSSGTKETMMREAMNQFLEDKDIRVDKYVQLDEQSIRDSVKFDEMSAQKEALASISDEELKANIKSRFGEEVKSPAIMYSDGTVKEGPSHFMIDGPLDPLSIEGFTTDKGRFVSREEAANIAGIGRKYMNHLDTEQRGDFWKAPEGVDQKEWAAHIKGQMQKNADEHFFSRPDIQQKLDEERQRRVQAFVDNARQNYDPKSEFDKAAKVEIQRQQSQGRLLSQDLIDKYLPADKPFNDMSAEMMSKDVSNLKENLTKKPQTSIPWEAYKKSGSENFKEDESGFVSNAKTPKEVEHVVVHGLGDEFASHTEEFGRWSHMFDSEGKPINEGIDEWMSQHPGEPIHIADNSGEKTKIVTVLPEEDLSPDEQAHLDSVPKPQSESIDASADCIAKKII